MCKNRLPGALTALLLLSLPLAAAAERPAPEADYLGWIPIQCVPAASGLVIDMRRFYQPAEGDRLELPEPESEAYRAAFDQARCELHLTIRPDAKGLVGIPLRVVHGNAKTSREGVLTVAIQVPGVRPSGDIPTVFAASRSPSEIVFGFRLAKDAHLGSVSVVAQLPDGSSRLLESTCQGTEIKVPTSSLPDATWVRVAVSDTTGRVSRAARAPVRATSEFLWQDGNIYYAFTDRFVNGDRSNDRPVEDAAVLPPANYQGGDFKGIQQRIEDGYFTRLGVNVLWLAPLNKNPDGAWKEYLPPFRSYTGYHGYWPVSESDVEPRFGGPNGLRDLVASAHRSNTRIIADLVLKHVHIENPLFRERPAWFGSLTLPDGRKNLRLWDEQQFTTWFEEWLPGFDFDKPEPVEFLIRNARNWAETFSLDGYRLDAVKHIRLSFWPKFRTAMRTMERTDGRAPMYFVGETFMDRRGIMSFVGPNMLDGQFDFPLYDTIIDVIARNLRGFDELERSLSESETIYGKETLMSPLVGNHDKPRFMAFADGDLPDPKNPDEEEVGWSNPPRVDDPASYEKLKLALAFILSIDGVPMIYYGDEVGLTGAGDPDNRRMLPPEEALTSEQRGVREFLGKVTALRQAHPSLRYGNRVLLLAEGDRYAFLRRHFDDTVVAVWNKSAQPATFDLPVAGHLPDGSLPDALGGRPLVVTDGIGKCTLPPRTSAFFVSKP